MSIITHHKEHKLVDYKPFLQSTTIEYNPITYTTITLPTNAGSIRLYAMNDCLFKFDTDEAIYMPQGTENFGIPAGATQISAKGASEYGILNVTGIHSIALDIVSPSPIVIPVQAGSSSAELPEGSKMRIFSMTDCFLAFGTSTVEATNSSTFFEAGTEILHVPQSATHIAVKRYTLNGGLYVMGIL